MADTAVPAPLADHLDFVLRKYGKIWIWSILATATAALTMRSVVSAAPLLSLGMIGSVPANRSYLTGSLIPALFMGLLPSAATIAAAYFLLQYLKWHLLPILFPPPPPPPPTASAEPATSFTFTGNAVVESSEVPDGAQLLYRCFLAIVVTLAIELAAPLVMLLSRLVT